MVSLWPTNFQTDRMVNGVKSSIVAQYIAHLPIRCRLQRGGGGGGGG